MLHSVRSTHVFIQEPTLYSTAWQKKNCRRFFVILDLFAIQHKTERCYYLIFRYTENLTMESFSLHAAARSDAPIVPPKCCAHILFQCQVRMFSVRYLIFPREQRISLSSMMHYSTTITSKNCSMNSLREEPAYNFIHLMVCTADCWMKNSQNGCSLQDSEPCTSVWKQQTRLFSREPVVK